MKRYSVVLLAIAAMLLASTGAQAVINAAFPKPDGSQVFKLNQGWLGSGEPVWYICTDTSDIRFATTQGLTLAPGLSRGFYGAGVGALFLVTNPAQSQGPVFEAGPGASQYSGIWRVRLVTWLDLSARVPLCSIGQILALQSAGKLTYTESDIRVDYSIMAVGRLIQPSQTTPPLQYVIPEAKFINVQSKTIVLPTWTVYCQDFITKKVTTGRIIVVDIDDAALAFQVGANFAPQLANWGNNPFQLAGTNQLYYMIEPKPVNQFPVEGACPTAFSAANRNYAYSPVQQVFVLFRNMPVSTVVNNPITVQQFIADNCLQIFANDIFINAPVIPSAPL